MNKVRTIPWRAAAALAVVLALAGCASQHTGSMDIADALVAPDDTMVVVTGEVVQQIAGERFLLRDHSGSVTVEIDDDLDTAALNSFQSIQKRTVNRGIASQLSQTLRFQRRHRRIEQLVSRWIRRNHTHVFVDHQKTFTHPTHRRFQERTDS